MGLSLIVKFVYVTLFIGKLCECMSIQNITGSVSHVIPCPDYGGIEFATIKPIAMDSQMYAIHIECKPGFELIGRHKLLCNEGKWEHSPRPQCIPKCNPPPFIENGRLDIEEENDINPGFHKKGTLAIYSCSNGYKLTPSESKYRVCEKGIWTGATAKCLPNDQLPGCKKPKDIANGYYVQEKNGIIDGFGFGIGQRLHYSCNSGYALEGSPIQQCLDDGTWSPRIPPSCITEINEPDSDLDSDSYIPCPILPLVSHASMEVVRGMASGARASPGAEVEFRCDRGFRNAFTSPCERIILRCSGGVWIGDLPSCVPVKGCLPPPSIANGRILGVAGEAKGGVQGGLASLYAPGAQVLYQCAPGFELRGSRVLSCSSQGCWEPLLRHPSCHEDEHWDDYTAPSGTLLVSVATASGVMLMLLAVCVGVACRRRKPWGRRPPGPASVPHRHLPAEPPGATDGSSGAALTASTLHDPDRLALIAFADQGQQQSQLPSYEEAIRERTSGPGSAGLLGYRSHRPHWTQHWTGAARRPRPAAAGGQSPADVHVTRQSSCTSHTPSLRSGSAGGDPMGSTDTMTPSEVSTNVTLDTVSSHSGSQPASCRAICGSLASFDTSSALNTEGVPLLEENEAEETSAGETSSIGVEFRSVADNASFKYRRTSPDLA